MKNPYEKKTHLQENGKFSTVETAVVISDQGHVKIQKCMRKTLVFPEFFLHEKHMWQKLQ